MVAVEDILLDKVDESVRLALSEGDDEKVPLDECEKECEIETDGVCDALGVAEREIEGVTLSVASVDTDSVKVTDVVLIGLDVLEGV
jgi:hypothetical protein